MAANATPKSALRVSIACLFFPLLLTALAQAQSVQPGTAYIFPAGGQRGTEVQVTVGGYNLTPSTQLHIPGSGIEVSRPLTATSGAPPPVPLIKGEQATRAYNYPREMTASLRIAAGESPGVHSWQVWTAQGGTSARAFVVGDLPEIVEELRGPRDVAPRRLSLPMTANGRIELAEEVDAYLFAAESGDRITCEVLADRIGSTLDAALVVVDPTGRAIARDEDSRSLDPMATFTAQRTGDYVVRVHDYAYTGSPSHVYRLTLRKSPPTESPESATTAQEVPFETDKTTRIREVEPNEDRPQAVPSELPVVVDCRLAAGDVDRFRFSGQTDSRLVLSIWAARIGTSVDTLLTISDAANKELARNDDISGSSDSEFEFVVPADGEYVLGVSDLSGAPRTDGQSPYCLYVGRAQPRFALQLATDQLDVVPSGKSQLGIKVERRGGFEGEINLELGGLPRGVTAEPLTIPAKQAEHKLSLNAAADADITGSALTVVGTATIGEQVVKRTATVRLPSANGLTDLNSVLITVTHPSRFKITADDTYFFRSRGTTHPAMIKIEREPGFDGDVVVSIADMQIRYLQGISGPIQTVPAGVNEIIYPLFIPETVELNRTCRVLITGTAEVNGPDGRIHHLLSVSPKQCVLRMEPAILALQSRPDFVELKPGRSAQFTLVVQRALTFNSAVHIELVLPDGAHGISAEPVDIAADATLGSITLNVSPDADLGQHEEIRFRATGSSNGFPVIAEAFIETELTAEKGILGIQSSR